MFIVVFFCLSCIDSVSLVSPIDIICPGYDRLRIIKSKQQRLYCTFVYGANMLTSSWPLKKDKLKRDAYLVLVIKNTLKQRKVKSDFQS